MEFDCLSNLVSAGNGKAARHVRSRLIIGGALAFVTATSATAVLAQEQAVTPASGTPAQNAAPASQASSTGAAPAATATPAAQATIQDVVVTSQQDPLLELPKPGTGITGDVLEKQHKTTIKDFTESVPALTVTAPNARNTRIAIRGLGKSSVAEALESSVGVIVDGVVSTNDAQTWGEYSDIERVDVLRGPQGFTFGKNTTLGAINVTTKPPSFTPEQEIAFTYGNRNLFTTTASATGTLIENTLAYRASVYFKTRDGFISSTIPGHDDWNDANRWGGRLQFLYTPNQNVTNRTIIDHSESDENVLVTYRLKDPKTWTNTGADRPITYTSRLARFGYATVYDPFNTADVKDQDPVVSKNNGVSTQTDWKVDGGYTLTSISAYRDYFFSALNDNDGTQLAINQGGFLVNGQQWSQELRITSPKEQDILGQKFDYVAGVFALRSEYDSTGRPRYGVDAGKFQASNAQYAATSAQALVDSLNGITVYTAEHPQTTSLAGYGQATWHATDKLDLTLGLRNTYEEKTNWTRKWYEGGVDLGSVYSGTDLTNASAIRNTTLALYSAGTNRINGDTIYADSWQWLVNPSYKLTDDILGYFSISYGEKSGAVQFNASSGLPQNVAPEEVIDYEVGLRTKWLDKKLTLNPNLYWTDITNYQATLSVILTGQTSATSILGNIPGVRNRGVELDGSYETPIEGLKFTFSGAFADATFSDFSNAPCPGDVSYSSGGVCDLTGRRFTAVSRWVGNVGVDYSRPVWDGYTAYFFASETFRSRSNLTPALSVYGWQGDYTITNAGIGLHPDNNAWDVSIWGKNIFDTRYYTSLGSFSPTAPVTGVIGDPLTFGVTFKAKL
jgi:iron complex outermembrane receptor protein